MPDFENLNASQRKAVCWEKGPLLVLAGPGSGKTTVIINRILYLLHQGISPDKILVITFTKEAALSMQNRFLDSAGENTNVCFGTFHSFFYHILKSTYPNKSFQILTNSQKKTILQPILKKYQNKDASTEEQNDELQQFLNAVSFYKNTNDLEKTLNKVPQTFRMYFEAILEEYQKKLRAKNCLDFDDMLFECHEILLRQETVRKLWQKRFPHILIDEFQDINPMQYEVLKLLTTSETKVFAVGDDDQAIYGFRGSRPELMQLYQKEFKSDIVLLDTNYRCREAIVTSSLKVINENKNRYKKELRAFQENQREHFIINSFPERVNQVEYLKNQLEEFRKIHNKDNEKIAVLFRTNAYMQGTAARLTAAGIPFVMKEKAKSIYEHFIVKDIMAYFMLAHGLYQREYFLRIMNRPVRYISRDAVAESRSLEDIKKKIQMFSQNKPYENGQLISLEKLEKQLKSLKNMNTIMGINYILKAVGYERYLKVLSAGKPEMAEEWEELIRWLKEEAVTFPDVMVWKEAQDYYNENIQTRASTKEESNEPIRLMTIHGSKGLEYHTVIIPDCNEKIFPHGSMPADEALEEERRIFYVGMTRAKECLELYYLTGDKNKPKAVSRFLQPFLKPY